MYKRKKWQGADRRIRPLPVNKMASFCETRYSVSCNDFITIFNKIIHPKG
jgi:hypothetical protein